MVNKNTEKTKARTPFAGIYRPPAVRRLLDSKTEETNSTCTAAPTFTTTSCSSEKKSARIKRPDQQMYIPRPKRFSNNTDRDSSSVGYNEKKDFHPKNKVFIREKGSKSKVNKREDETKDNTLKISALDVIEDSELAEAVDTSQSEYGSTNSSFMDQSFVSIENEFSFGSSQIKPDEIIVELNSNSSFKSCTATNIDSPAEEENNFQLAQGSDLELSNSFQSGSINESNCDRILNSDSKLSCPAINQSLSISCSELEDLRSATSKLEPDKGESTFEPSFQCSLNNVSDCGILSVTKPESENCCKDIIIEQTSITVEVPESQLLHSTPPINCSDKNSSTNVEKKQEANVSKEPLIGVTVFCENESQLHKSEGHNETSTKLVTDVADDWELLLNENNEFLDPSLLEELEEAVGKVNISRPTSNYKEFQTIEERTSDGECIIEIYGFSSELRTHDLMNIFSPFCGKNFHIAWVDDTHALGVFSSPNIADDLLSMELPFVKTRPLREGLPESRCKASKLVLPPLVRPKTCPALARRLVTGALGLRLPTSKTEREAERKVLKEARDKKRQEAKIRKDIWEGN